MFLIQCGGCGESDEVDKMSPPAGWSEIFQKTYGSSQADDTVVRDHLCPDCSQGAIERAVKV